jgi:hypothetical protein
MAHHVPDLEDVVVKEVELADPGLGQLHPYVPAQGADAYDQCP